MACRGHEESTELCDLLPIAEEAVVSAVFHLYYKLRHQGGPILTQLLADLQTPGRQAALEPGHRGT